MKLYIRYFVRFNSSAAPNKKWAKYVPSTGSYPKGYKVGAVHCGVKAKNEALDLSLITSDEPCNAAAVFTTNKFKAAPVQLSKKVLHESQGANIHSIVINSGCANAVTGEKGYKDAETIVNAVDSAFDHNKLAHQSSLIMSTGVIGQLLPLQKVLAGVDAIASARNSVLGDLHEHWLNCAKGIMTTDTFPKLVSKSFFINGREYRLAGLSKGAGMICPNMATLLGYFVTDVPIAPSALKSILKYAVDRSFNCISVDGDMSTNDTIAALSNGSADDGNIEAITESSPHYNTVRDEVTQFAKQLSQLVVRDGEGATKFVTIKVTDGSSYEVAKKIASSIANSSLVKTALYGKDANWGRILCAVGYADLGAEHEKEVVPAKTSVSFVPVDGSTPLKLLVNGEPQKVDEQRASEILESEDLQIVVNIGTGKGQEASFWTCDLTHDYVTINGDYRS